MKRLLSNLGFILQFCGFFIFFVAILATYLNESKEAISFFLTASIFFILGFPLNILAERKDVSFRESLILFFLTFIILGIIGSIPYIYLDVFSNYSIEEKVINSIFESVSGFTTTGFTFLSTSDISKSLIIYRATSQFIGGIGIVYLLLTFLYSENYKFLGTFRKLFGFDEKLKIKRSIYEILLYFFSITLILSLLMYSINKDIIKSFSLIMSGISTGGFPHYDLKQLSLEEKILVITSMIFGSISLFILSKFKAELPIYILFIISTFMIFSMIYNLNLIDSFFHSVSIVSTTGYYYIDFNIFPSHILLIFSLFMLIGGMSISTSGGVKIIRLINSIKGICKIIKGYITESEQKLEVNEMISIAYLLTYIFVWIILSVIFSLYLSDLEKSMFNMASSLTSSGFSTGEINVNIPTVFKILIIFTMILARIEIIPIFAIFIFNSEEK